MKTFEQTDRYFVLSTGRAGTSFLYQMLQRSLPEAVCFQEPAPSWRFNIASNLYSEGRLPPAMMRWLTRNFIASRTRLLRRQTETGNSLRPYIEINPFLYAFGNNLRESLGELKILHLVRHPFTYITSSLNFRPPGWRGRLIQKPVWNVNVSRALKSARIPWGKISPAERKAWQWRYINEQISAYQTVSSRFLPVKFENLVSGESRIRQNTLEAISHFFGGLKFVLPGGRFFEDKANPSRPGSPHEWKHWDAETKKSILSICGGLMEKYGYTGIPEVYR